MPRSHTARLSRPSRSWSVILLAGLVGLCAIWRPATAEEIIYKVKWKDREFHLVGSVPFRLPDDPLNQTMLKLVDVASAVAIESDFIIASKAAENLDLAMKAAADMPAKDMPAALKTKYKKALAKAGREASMTDLMLVSHLVDAALHIQEAVAPFPDGAVRQGADNFAMIRASVKGKPVMALLPVKSYYASYAQVPRTAIESYIDLAADALLDAQKGAAWKTAYQRCYEAQRTQLPTPAYDACTRDLNQSLKIPAPWLRGIYDQRNPVLVDSLLAIVEKQDKLLVSLNHVYLGGKEGVLNLLKQKGATFARVSGGPAKK